AGISGTLPTYSIENVRSSAGLRKLFSTTCWAGAPAQQESPLEQPSPPVELQPAERTSRATADRNRIMEHLSWASEKLIDRIVKSYYRSNGLYTDYYPRVLRKWSGRAAGSGQGISPARDAREGSVSPAGP